MTKKKEPSEQKPKVHYTDVYDPVYFKNVTIPILLKAIEEVEQLRKLKIGECK